MNAFEILNLSDTATPKEVRARYQKLCMKFHPDRGGDQNVFVRVKEAYEEAIRQAEKAVNSAAQNQRIFDPTCPQCHGRGYVRIQSGFSQIKYWCPACTRVSR